MEISYWFISASSPKSGFYSIFAANTSNEAHTSLGCCWGPSCTVASRQPCLSFHCLCLTGCHSKTKDIVQQSDRSRQLVSHKPIVFSQAHSISDPSTSTPPSTRQPNLLVLNLEAAVFQTQNISRSSTKARYSLICYKAANFSLSSCSHWCARAQEHWT